MFTRLCRLQEWPRILATDDVVALGKIQVRSGRPPKLNIYSPWKMMLGRPIPKWWLFLLRWTWIGHKGYICNKFDMQILDIHWFAIQPANNEIIVWIRIQIWRDSTWLSRLIFIDIAYSLCFKVYCTCGCTMVFPFLIFGAAVETLLKIVAGAAKTVSRSETGAGDGGEVVQLKLPSETSN